MPRVWKTFYNSIQVRRPSSGSHGREKLSLQLLREDVHPKWNFKEAHDKILPGHERRLWKRYGVLI